MNNILNRGEYIQKMNEGFVGDTIKKGVQKIKSIFKLAMMKIKGFIAIFDNKGNVLPVVSPQAALDGLSKSKSVGVFASEALNDTIVNAGGNPCPTTAEYKGSDEIYDDGPDGRDEYSEWLDKKGYKDDIEYKNFMSIPGIIKECYGYSDDEFNALFESGIWSKVEQERVKYKDSEDLGNAHELSVKKFEEIITKMVNERSNPDYDNMGTKPMDNILVFGAPGIGKSTIPEMVVEKWNEGKNPNDMISLININCALLSEGDFMMPTMPKPVDVTEKIEEFGDTFPEANAYLDSMTPLERKKFASSVSGSGQFKSSDSPKSWLPSYLPTGNDDVDDMLDAYANSGVITYTSNKKNILTGKMETKERTRKTGAGGIIIFDEFLRSPEGLFSQLMNFFLNRKLHDWTLGSKWTIIACSNRPCDDGQVAEVWNGWNDSFAAKDRFEAFYQLIPDPISWKKWALSKGYDRLILDFIFSKKDADGEYPYWHTGVRGGSGESSQLAPVTPRRWERACNELVKFERHHNMKDMSQMTLDQIKECLVTFDKSFVDVITTWLDVNMNTVSLDSIIKDPVNTYLPEKFKGAGDADAESAAAKKLISNILDQMKKKYTRKDDDETEPEVCTDKDLFNIFVWMGINYKHDVNLVFREFVGNLDEKIFPRGNFIENHIEANMVLRAAWPCDDIEEVVDDWSNDSDESRRWPKDALKKIKGYMRKYFPWRIDGDEIKFISLDDEGTISDGTEEK